MKRRTAWFAIVVTCCLLTIGVDAQTLHMPVQRAPEPVGGVDLPPGVSPDEVPAAFTLIGELSADGAFTDLKVEVVSGNLQSIEVYAEPSHTLIAALVDKNNSEQTVQRRQSSSLVPEDAVLRTSLHPGARIAVSGQRAQDSDIKLSIKVRGLFGNDIDPTDQVMNVTTNMSKFHFTLKRFKSDGIICCGGINCAGGCTFCPGQSEYTCCLETSCVWCDHGVAYCGSHGCGC